MKVLLVNQFFWPDSAATSQLLTDLAPELRRRGHEVRVLCSRAAYAEAGDTSTPPEVEIHRSGTLPFGRGKLGRVLSYASFLVTAGYAGMRGEKPDVVVTLTTPPLISLLGTLLKKLRRVRHYSWEMDVYPDIACDLGVLREGNPLVKLIGQIADYSRKQADGVIALGECMQRRLIARGLSPAKVHVAENWADGAAIVQAPFVNDGKLKVLYSGNLGLGHDVRTLCESMRDLRDDPRFQFTFAGGGPRRKQVDEFCSRHGVANVTFKDYSSRQTLGAHLAGGDLGLVTQESSCSGSLVPSKLYGLLAAGRPVLFIGPRDSTVAQTILRSRCGWLIDCDDSRSLSHLLRRLAANPAEVQAAGARARIAFDEGYDLSQGTGRVCSLILDGGSAYPATRPAVASESSAPEALSPKLKQTFFKLEKE